MTQVHDPDDGGHKGHNYGASGDITAMRNVILGDSSDVDQREMVNVGNISANQRVDWSGCGIQQ